MWIEQIKNSYIGDPNLDGEFSTSDFVPVFDAGEFDDAVSGNSTWETGDWNGDGDFGTGDFVAAFGAGGFEQGQRPGGPKSAVAAVPEPTNAALALLGLAGLGVVRRRR